MPTMKKVFQGEGVKYTAVLFRLSGNRMRKLDLTGYGYAVDNSHNGFVHIDNGVMIVLTHTDYIEENYGKNVVFEHKNDRNIGPSDDV